MSRWTKTLMSGWGSRLFASSTLLLALSVSGLLAQSTGNKAFFQSDSGRTAGRGVSASSGVSTEDEDFARSVKEWTTRPEFASPLVDHLTKVDGIPSPKE